MKRLICLLLTIIAMLSLLGCNNETEDRIAELEAKLQAQSESLLALQQSNDGLQEKVNSLLQKNNDLQSKLDDNDIEKEELNEQIELMDAQIWNLTGNEINYTAQMPVFEQMPDTPSGQYEGYELYKEFDRSDYYNEIIWEAEEQGIYVPDPTFEKYYEYCVEQFGDEFDFLLLAPMLTIYDYNFVSMARNYEVYVKRDEDKEIIDVLFVEFFRFYSYVLGDGEWHSGFVDGQDHTSMTIKMVSRGHKLTFWGPTGYAYKYGKESDKYPSNYVNIYESPEELIGGLCVATCYFESSAYMSERWFEGEYLYNYLRQG